MEKVQSEIARARGKLSNQGFVAKAPAQLIDAEKAKLAKYEELLAQLEQRLAELRS